MRFEINPSTSGHIGNHTHVGGNTRPIVWGRLAFDAMVNNVNFNFDFCVFVCEVVGLWLNEKAPSSTVLRVVVGVMSRVKISLKLNCTWKSSNDFMYNN